MDRPECIDKYIELKEEMNKLEKEHKKLRIEVLSILKESGGFEDISIRKDNKEEYNEDLIYDWIKSEYPDKLDLVRKETLDWEKFHSLVRLGEIDITQLPDNCAKYTQIEKIIIKKNEPMS